MDADVYIPLQRVEVLQTLVQCSLPLVLADLLGSGGFDGGVGGHQHPWRPKGPSMEIGDGGIHWWCNEGQMELTLPAMCWCRAGSRWNEALTAGITCYQGATARDLCWLIYSEMGVVWVQNIFV